MGVDMTVTGFASVCSWDVWDLNVNTASSGNQGLQGQAILHVLSYTAAS